MDLKPLSPQGLRPVLKEGTHGKRLLEKHPDKKPKPKAKSKSTNPKGKGDRDKKSGGRGKGGRKAKGRGRGNKFRNVEGEEEDEEQDEDYQNEGGLRVMMRSILNLRLKIPVGLSIRSIR